MKEQHLPKMNTLEDQKREALAHYEELAKKCHHWNSFVVTCIKDYIPSSEDEPCDAIDAMIEFKGTDQKMFRYSDEKPPKNKTVLFIWWHRNGFETSQKTLGYLSDEDRLIFDFTPAGGKMPDFWSFLQEFEEAEQQNKKKTNK